MKRVEALLGTGLHAALPIVVAAAATLDLRAAHWTNRSLLDERGRQIIPGGFVVLENVDYTPEDYDRCQRECLLPLLRDLSDALHQISQKWALYQPLLRKPEDQWAPGKNPVVTIEEPFGRKRTIFAPHLYQMDLSTVAPMLDDFERRVAISNVPLLLGEWGPPTRANTDGTPRQEARYTTVYRATVNVPDRRCIGGIKAWFCGTRKPIPVKDSANWISSGSRAGADADRSFK